MLFKFVILQLCHTRRELGKCPDNECVILSKDYKGIAADHPTAVAFSRAKLWDAGKIVACLKSGHLKSPWGGDVTPETVEKILLVAKKSIQLNGDFKKLL